MKNIIKKTMLLLFVGGFILPTFTLANGRIVYGKNCMGHGGTVDCNGWKVFIATEIDGQPLIPIVPNLTATDGMVFPKFSSSITLRAACDARGEDMECIGFHFNYPTYITITDPNGISKKFTYLPFRGECDRQPYIKHDEIHNTGGASLNEPENGSVTIEGSGW